MKEVFVVDVLQLVLQHYQLFNHHHVTKVIAIATTYQRNMGHFNDSFL
jgi:ABC-type sulfate/molybdate transport systems ATPase subunit